MATGISIHTDIQANSKAIYEAALYTLRENNMLAQTVANYDGMGMQARKATRYTQSNVREAGEGDDVTPTQFGDSDLNTLTPARYVDTFLLTDQMVETAGAAGINNVRADAALELGTAFAADVDNNIAGLFGSLTGGTVGTSGSALTWDDIFEAEATLMGLNVPKPYAVALHPKQYRYLLKEAISEGSFMAPAAADALLRNAIVSPMIDGVFFMRTSQITAGTAAVGAMYSRLAMALDIRKPFNIRPQRDESRESWELNASMWYAYGVWDPQRGVQIIAKTT